MKNVNPFDPGYYQESELREMGFKSVGDNVRIQKNCTILGVENIQIGNNVRIDAFCTLSASGTGWIELGSYIHIAPYCFLSAGDGIYIDDFSSVSSGSAIYSRNDDYSGNRMTNPTVSDKYTGVTHATVKLEKHVIVGSGCVILPGVTIGEGSSIGALSLVNKSLESWNIYAGTPAKKIRERSKRLLELENELKKDSDLKY